MKTNRLIVMALAAAFSTAAFADDTENRINAYDENDDGELSYSEASADEQLSARFEELDADRSGTLSSDEIGDVGETPATDEYGADEVSQDAQEDPIDDEMTLEGAAASSEEEGVDDAGADILTDEQDEEIENTSDDTLDDDWTS